MQFLPAVEHGRCRGFPPSADRRPGARGGAVGRWSVTAGAGQFLCDIFDEWVVSDVGQVFVQMFDASLSQWCGVQPGVCSMGETCGDALVVEHNGDVYSCDHFVYPEYKLGNIRETPLVEIYRSKKRRDFGLAKRNALPAECLRCRYYFACRGECPKHRFETGSDGCRKNTLCEGLYHYFRHVEPYMEYMREMLSEGAVAGMGNPIRARKRMGLMQRLRRRIGHGVYSAPLPDCRSEADEHLPFRIRCAPRAPSCATWCGMVDGRRSAVEEAGDMSAVGNSEPHDGQDPQFGGQRLVGTYGETGRLFEQGVDLLDEIEEDAENVSSKIGRSPGSRGRHPTATATCASGPRALFFCRFPQFVPVLIDPADVLCGQVHVAEHVVVP